MTTPFHPKNCEMLIRVSVPEVYSPVIDKEVRIHGFLWYWNTKTLKCRSSNGSHSKVYVGQSCSFNLGMIFDPARKLDPNLFHCRDDGSSIYTDVSIVPKIITTLERISVAARFKDISLSNMHRIVWEIFRFNHFIQTGTILNIEQELDVNNIQFSVNESDVSDFKRVHSDIKPAWDTEIINDKTLSADYRNLQRNEIRIAMRPYSKGRESRPLYVWGWKSPEMRLRGMNPKSCRIAEGNMHIATHLYPVIEACRRLDPNFASTFYIKGQIRYKSSASVDKLCQMFNKIYNQVKSPKDVTEEIEKLQKYAILVGAYLLYGDPFREGAVGLVNSELAVVSQDTISKQVDVQLLPSKIY